MINGKVVGPSIVVFDKLGARYVSAVEWKVRSAKSGEKE